MDGLLFVKLTVTKIRFSLEVALQDNLGNVRAIILVTSKSEVGPSATADRIER